MDAAQRLGEWLDYENITSGRLQKRWEQYAPHDDVQSLLEQLQSAQDEINERTSDQALTLRKYRELQEQLETYRGALEEIRWRDPIDLGYVQFVQHAAYEALKGSNPASQPWKYGDPIKGTMTVSSPAPGPSSAGTDQPASARAGSPSDVATDPAESSPATVQDSEPVVRKGEFSRRPEVHSATDTGTDGGAVASTPAREPS